MQNKKKIYIIGAGGSGREIESWFRKAFKNSGEWDLVGYIDDNPNALDNFPSEYKVLGDVSNFNFNKDGYALISVTNPVQKEIIFSKLNKRVKFFTYIDPSVVLGQYANIGEASVICHNSIISTNVKIGKCVFINCGTQIGHDSEIGDFSSLMASVDIGGECVLEKSVYMGTKSLIIPRKKISSGVFIGGGSVVTRNLKTPGTYFGSPATLL